MVRRSSKEPSINLHMKSNNIKESSIKNNSHYVGSTNTITAKHMEAISPQKI